MEGRFLFQTLRRTAPTLFYRSSTSSLLPLSRLSSPLLSSSSSSLSLLSTSLSTSLFPSLSPPPLSRSFHSSPSPFGKKPKKKGAPPPSSKKQVKGAVRGAGPSSSSSSSPSPSSPSSPSSSSSTPNGGERGGKTQGNRKGEGNPLKTIVQFEGLTKVAGARTLLNNQDGGIYEGAKLGILGINGAGKSTFLKILAGVDDEYDGEINYLPGLKVGYLAQEPELNEDLTIAETLKDNLKDAYKAWDEYNALHTQFRELQRDKQDVTEVKKQLDEKRKFLDEKGWNNLEKRVQKGLVALRCPPPESQIKGLSGGERRRVALCSLLMQQPDFLLLDEPTNHLDAESVAYLERFLREYKGTVVAVTHDRYFLDNSAGWIVEVADGKLHPHKGNYTTWLESKERRLELEEKKDKNMSNFLKRELEWIRKPAAARQAKSRARVKKYEKMVEERKERRWESGRIVIPPGRRLGDIVLEVENLSKTTPQGKKLFRDLSFSIPPGAIVGIVGPNGCGKTTLLKTLLGEIEADSGISKMGQSVEAGYVAQSRAELDEEKTVHDEIANGADEIDMGGGNMISSRVYTAQFHFKGKDQGKLIKHLSGGERNRVHLAKMLNYGYNLIVLDEPTNDLDVQVLSSLEDALSEFVGSSLIVSHDRWFLDRVCTHILYFSGEGEAEFFDGNYADFMKARGDQKKKSKYIAI